MTRGQKTALRIRLTLADRQTLLAWQREDTIPAGQRRRGRIVLLLADGMSITQIAHMVGINRRFVYKWVKRFQTQGLAGLADIPHTGPRRRWRVGTLPASSSIAQAHEGS